MIVWDVPLHFLAFFGFANHRVHDGKSIAKQEIRKDLNKMANLIKLIPLLKKLQIKEHKSGDQINRQWHHLKHTFPIISPRPIQCENSEPQYQQIECKEKPLSM